MQETTLGISTVDLCIDIVIVNTLSVYFCHIIVANGSMHKGGVGYFSIINVVDNGTRLCN